MPHAYNPIRGMMHLPQDCADLTQFDWRPLSDTPRAADTRNARSSNATASDDTCVPLAATHINDRSGQAMKRPENTRFRSSIVQHWPAIPL